MSVCFCLWLFTFQFVIFEIGILQTVLVVILIVMQVLISGQTVASLKVSPQSLANGTSRVPSWLCLNVFSNDFCFFYANSPKAA